MYPTLLQDTICAIATPRGYSATGMIKVSGKDAITTVDKIFRGNLSQQKPRTVCYGWIYNPNTQELLDDVVVTVYHAPNSYTGEDVVEIGTHGSPLILSEIMELLCNHGARIAQPGEYTRRAFANGKMDLSQAEAVADVIASTNKAALRMSLAQMKGGYSQRIQALRAPLVELCALMELELDFSEEEVAFADRTELKSRCHTIQTEINELVQSYRTGKAIKEGIPIAIVGATNAGKSTLLNALLGEERAIVSDLHGTTRDTIEDTLLIEGKEYRIIDTAGLRDTSDTIENIGIQRAVQQIEQAELVIWVIDANAPEQIQEIGTQILQYTPTNKVLPILNKIDATPSNTITILKNELLAKGWPPPLQISAKEESYTKVVCQAISDRFSALQVNEGDVIVSNLRHVQALQNASTALTEVAKGLTNHIPSDLVVQDLRSAIRSLGEVVGEVSTDDLLQHIFSHFCIGK